jgi:hypothetical protein
MTVAAHAVQQAADVMTLKDYAYIAAVAISLLMFFLAYRRDKNSQGDSELKLFEIITKAEKDLVDLDFKRSVVAGEDEAALNEAEALNDQRKAYLQYVLNSYDMGCQRYLDGKLDKTRFAKTYGVRIKEINSGDMAEGIGKDFKYAALDRVNDMINNKERGRWFR